MGETISPSVAHVGYGISYLDLHFEIGSGGRLKTKPYDKRDDSLLQ